MELLQAVRAKKVKVKANELVLGKAKDYDVWLDSFCGLVWTFNYSVALNQVFNNFIHLELWIPDCFVDFNFNFLKHKGFAQGYNRSVS